MADRLYLSVWLRNPNPENQLFRFERLLRAFPFSKLTKGESTLRVYGVDFTQAPIAETLLAGVVQPETVIEMCKEFFAPDSAFQLDAFWDIWRYEDDDWSFAPAPVSIYSFSREFEREDNEDFRIEFGLDTQFLPISETAGGVRMVRSNIQSLLSLVKDIENRLPIERRVLWSESGENFAEVLQRKLVSLTQDVQ